MTEGIGEGTTRLYTTAKARYGLLELERAPFLERAYKCSEISIPGVLPRNRTHNALPTPYQSAAAQGSNNLASKLMLSLLPPNAPFFKLAVDRSALSEEERGDLSLNDEMEKGLAVLERAIMQEISSYNDRVMLFEALKHVIICGNVLLWCNEEGGMVCHHLDSYVVNRDSEGKPIEIIIKALLKKQELTDDMRACLIEPLEEEASNSDHPDEEYDLYTWARLEDDQWEYHQEIRDRVIPDTHGTCPKESCDWIPIRMIAVSGENYGRSYVEEYYGDIMTLEGLTQAIVEGSAAAARLIWLVAPNAVLKIDDLTRAPNLGYVVGNPQDIIALQTQKQADLRIASETAMAVERRLQYAFLLNNAIQRNAERVTAEEIRKMIEDLDAALGGVYSLLAQEFQVPYIAARIRHLQKRDKIPKYPEKVVKPIIVTGVEALGRGNDQNRLVMFISDLSKYVPAALNTLKLDTLVTRLATAQGIDTANLVKTQEEVQAEQRQAQQMEMLNKLGPAAMKAGTDMYGTNPNIVSDIGNMGQTQQ
jgi:hypothetical protein